MSGDLIRRQDAIDACRSVADDFDRPTYQQIGAEYCLDLIKEIPSAEPEEEVFEWCHDCKEYDQEKHCCHRWTKVIRRTVEEMRSQQSEQKRTFLGVDVSYPTICTYPEYEGKPYYAIKYLEDGETIVGFGTYKPDVLSEYLRKYFIQFVDTERTAKVVHSTTFGEWKNMCGHCFAKGRKMGLFPGQNYCYECGCKLEWSDDDEA